MSVQVMVLRVLIVMLLIESARVNSSDELQDDNTTRSLLQQGKRSHNNNIVHPSYRHSQEFLGMPNIVVPCHAQQPLVSSHPTPPHLAALTRVEACTMKSESFHKGTGKIKKGCRKVGST